MMNGEQFKELSHKLDTIIKLIGYAMLKDVKTKTDKAGVLYSLGLGTKEIALIVGTTEGSVETMKKRLRKRGKQKKSKRKDGEKSGKN